MSESPKNDAVEAFPWSALREFDPSRMMAESGKGMAALVDAQEHMISRLAAMNSELADFVDRRLAHDQETVRKLAECRSPQDAATVWMAFVDTAARQYAAEMSTLAGLGVEQAREAAQSLEGTVDEASAALADARKKN